MYGVYALLYNLDTHEQSIVDSEQRFENMDEAVTWMDFDGDCEFFAQSVTLDTELMGGGWFLDDIVTLPVTVAESMEAEFNGTV